jgi:hypothetical protein
MGWDRTRRAAGLAALVVASCANPAARVVLDPIPSDGTGDHTRHAAPASLARTGPAAAYILTVNVELAETGFSPEVVSLPAGRPIRLVVRNRGQQEHHYHVQGLVPMQMLWLAKTLDDRRAEQLDHTAHHTGDLVDYHICTSRAGICPTGNSVHAHAEASEIDVVQFTPANTGTFQVFDPLHPNLRGTVIVY